MHPPATHIPTLIISSALLLHYRTLEDKGASLLLLLSGGKDCCGFEGFQKTALPRYNVTSYALGARREHIARMFWSDGIQSMCSRALYPEKR